EYFPAYEILLDDLRDYRFYTSDLIHPTTDAVDYIWKKFSSHYFDLDTKGFLEEWQKILKALTHKSFHSTTETHQNFLKETLKRLNALKSKVNVAEEIKLVEAQLIPEPR
ncbi:MAG: GSCFA domain-containing protein, partial [Bacteroidia bacterium]|nr:GSCFA domain-containing protein [Bacteroidia bacterium]